MENEGSWLCCHFSCLGLCQFICGTLPWCWDRTTPWRDLMGLASTALFVLSSRAASPSSLSLRSLLRSSLSFCCRVVLLSCRFVVVSFCCLRVGVTERHNQYLRTIGQNLGHVRTQDRFSINIATKQEQRKHNVDHNDDDVDDSGPDALHAAVNEERMKVYDPG